MMPCSFIECLQILRGTVDVVLQLIDINVSVILRVKLMIHIPDTASYLGDASAVTKSIVGIHIIWRVLIIYSKALSIGIFFVLFLEIEGCKVSGLNLEACLLWHSEWSILSMESILLLDSWILLRVRNILWLSLFIILALNSPVISLNISPTQISLSLHWLLLTIYVLLIIHWWSNSSVLLR
jgi:hypothetical protein